MLVLDPVLDVVFEQWLFVLGSFETLVGDHASSRRQADALPCATTHFPFDA